MADANFNAKGEDREPIARGWYYLAQHLAEVVKAVQDWNDDALALAVAVRAGSLETLKNYPPMRGRVAVTQEGQP